MKIIAVDAGKYATKALAASGDKVLFRTKSTQLTASLDIEATGNSNKVIYEDDTYIIGEQGEQIDYGLEKNTLLHKMAIYTAAYRLGCKGEIAAVIGCPTNIYLSKENRKAFQDNIKQKPKKFVVDGKLQNIDFKRVLIMPESSGVVYTNKELFIGKRVGVIDLGGRNMNFGIYDNLVPQPNSMMTTNQGSMHIEAMIKREFEARYRRGLAPRDIENIILNGGIKYQGKFEPESKKALSKIYKAYVEEVIADLKKEFPLDLMDIVVTGGTSILVKEALQEVVPHAQTVEETQWTNVAGFLEIGKVKFK
ncbi:ParM/StbA family protein [Niameybacter massiliensis]|uniref:ParM/StbA family protein n=1 Tax=Holtiella tumoricola TaxID=3018743 RepID=A0AA42DN34_9FIRM|nr:ParM/StbA family protein [Holtiella tumoricola]MDA3732055.1 ParM/StbA family protein [Holtiella tumoricola]